MDALAENYRFLSRYNRWFNERLYAACESLSDAERKRDRGAFFGSIHLTLNHLVWADTVWLGRFARQGCDFASLSAPLLRLPQGANHRTELFGDFSALRAHRARLDAAIDAWVADTPPRAGHDFADASGCGSG